MRDRPDEDPIWKYQFLSLFGEDGHKCTSSELRLISWIDT